MVLFKEDTEKYKGMIYDWDTPNKSFIEIVGIFERLGVDNRFFPLTLLNPRLKGVDPHNVDLDMETKLLIVKECKENFWYYIREVVKITPIGAATPIKFRANRFNIAMFWLFFGHITTFGTIPRQVGKTFTLSSLASWLVSVGGYNTRLNLLTKSRKLRNDTILQVKSILDGLPDYLDLRNKTDKNNLEEITVNKLLNKFSTSIAQESSKRADALGRGHTYNIQFIDELPFCPNIDITLPIAISSSNAAVENAKRVNGLYGFIYTTTAGFLATKEGKFAYKLRNDSFPWCETLFDSKNVKELREIVEKNNLQRLQEEDENVSYAPVRILLEFNHRQLGYTDAWLKEKIIESGATGDKLRADYFNIWCKGTMSSPISQEYMDVIHKSTLDTEEFTEISRDRYITRWYIKREEVEDGVPNRYLILAIDPSEAIGKDDIGLLLMDSNTGEVIGVGNYSETNLYIFANFLFTFFTRFENIVLVPERRSSGTALLDILISLMLKNGYDPLRYIFNWIVNDSDVSYRNQDILKERNKDLYFYNSIKKEFGYATSGTGRASRDNLYGSTFLNALKYIAHYARDKILITQLSGLVYRNNRIDHQDDGKDDLVICWLLCYWFLTNAKNKDKYGIPSNKVLQRIRTSIKLSREEEDNLEEEKKINLIKGYIEILRNKIRKEKHPINLRELIGKHNFLINQLVTEDEDDDLISIEDLNKADCLYKKIRVR